MPKAVYRKYAGLENFSYSLEWTPLGDSYSFGYPNEYAYSDYTVTKEGLITLVGRTGILSAASGQGTVYFYCQENSDPSSTTSPVKKGVYAGTFSNAYGQRRVKLSNCYRSTEVKEEVTYSRGAYLSDVILDLGTVPENGRHTDGYWYEYLRPACEVRARVDGIWRDAPEEYANVGGILHPVEEIKLNNHGIWKG